MHNKTRLHVTLTLLAMTLSGCAGLMPTRGDLSSLPETLSERPESMTLIEDFDGKNIRVVTRTRAPIAPDTDTKENILKQLEQGLDRELGERAGIVIDRKLGDMVRDEIELAEIYGKLTERQDADAVLLVVLDSYRTEDKQELKSALLDPDKKYYDCDYSAAISGWVRAYEIPSMRNIGQWDYDESSSDSFDEPTLSVGCGANIKERMPKLTSKLIDTAVCKNSIGIANALAPQGHVLSIKKGEKEVLLEISLGSNMNIKPDDTIRLYHEITGEYYAEGFVTKDISATTAWMQLKVLHEGKSVYMGDWAKPYKSDLLGAAKLRCLF